MLFLAEWRWLSGKLQRVRIEDGRAVAVKPIDVTGHIRDIADGKDGRMVLWTDQQALEMLEPADTSAPGAVVNVRAATCLTSGQTLRLDPNVWINAGRSVGSTEDFDNSDALQKYGRKWTREWLDQFLEDPAGTVPGTSIQFTGIRDQAKRYQLIRHLGRLRQKSRSDDRGPTN
jgi:cytochrome c